MSFSASPMVPGQAGPGTDDWSAAATLVLEAVTEALSQVPASQPLRVGQPSGDLEATALPAGAGVAVTGYLGGAVEGKVLLVVGAEVGDALTGTPFGDLEPAAALRPALETVADRLGGRLAGDPASVDVQDCLSLLAAGGGAGGGGAGGGGATVLVPLLAGDTVAALLGVTLTVAPDPGGARAAATATAPARAGWGLDALRDVEMEVTCELGRTRMTVRQLLALAPGDVVELDRLAGAPADLLVNGTLLARGEVVVVDESFGLRITEIVTRDAT